MNTVTMSYEELCERGRIAAQSMDTGRWAIGDLACDVEKHYSKDMIEDFAREVNVPKASVKAYRTVCRFYEKSTRYDFLEEHPNITFTHMRYAMRMGEPLEAYDFLEHASAQGWTTDETAHHIAEQLGKVTPNSKVFDRVVSVSYGNDVVAFHCDALLTDGATYRVVITEAL